MNTSDFFYDLPEELIAQTPLEPRDSSRMMVLSKENDNILHKHFYDVCDCLNKGDTLILNNTRVLPARIYGVKEETGADIKFINLSGGIGIPYRPEQEANDIYVIGEGVRKAYEEVLTPAGMDDVAIYTELGRYMMGPYGCLVTQAIHEKHTHKEYVGVDACAVNLMRPAMYSGLPCMISPLRPF